jgi:ATP-binding cassette, subfamily B, beta-glucan exporter
VPHLRHAEHLGFAADAALQKSVERYYSDLAEHASDTLGNVALVQSFTRVELEGGALRNVVDRLLGAQTPVLSWWAWSLP